MLIFIILIVTILCMIFFMVKISDRGDAVAFACKDLEPLSSPEQSSVSKHRPKQNSDCPSGVARPAKQPEFQLVLHQG